MITMSSRRHVLAVGMIVALAVSSWGEETQTNATLSLAIDLVDGSRLIGTPGIATVPVQTPYAKMDVPLTQIQALKIGDDHETVTLNLRNGDKLTGVISLAPIKLITVFGTVAVGIEHIQQLDIVLSGGTGQKGLILWNRLGSESEVKNSRVGLGGKLNAGRFVEGRFGQGIELNMQEPFGVTFPAEICHLPILVTVERVAQHQPFLQRLGQRPAGQHNADLLDVLDSDRNGPEHGFQLNRLEADHAGQFVAVAQIQSHGLVIVADLQRLDLRQRHIHLGVGRLHGYVRDAGGADDV